MRVGFESDTGGFVMKHGMYAMEHNDGFRCGLCPHYCLLSLGQTGICRVRRVEAEGLMSLNYGKISAMQIDPVEKKPLARFMGGTNTFSIGSYGCNFRCPYCQNYHIAMEHPETIALSPGDVVQKALEARTPSISFTYNEPVVSYEFVLDTAQMAKENGLATILVTNGFICQEPLRELLPFVDAMNIDLKAFTEQAYRKFCGGSLKPVMETISMAVEMCHVEVTTLLVTGMHQEGELEAMVKWLASLSNEIPLHISRYFPRHQYSEPATTLQQIHETQEMARKHLAYVYAGNV